MGTVSGLNTRRYHGHLVAAIDPPADRMVLLDSVEAFAVVGSESVGLSVNQYPGALHPQGHSHLSGFSCSPESVNWSYEFSGAAITKTLELGQGMAVLTFTNTGKRPLTLNLKPLVCHKRYHENFRATPDYPEEFALNDHRLRIEHAGTSLELDFEGAACQPMQGWYYRFEHQREIERGLDGRDDLFCPCELTCALKAGASFQLTVSTDQAKPPQRRNLSADALTEACEVFLVQGQRSSIIAGYPWFTDWGRDTMISLPGICLANGHVDEAKYILIDYASQMRNGLIPNRFVEGASPDYNTVDASLWFANAAYRVLEASWDSAFARQISPTLHQILEWHQTGTDFGIVVDQADGLLMQGDMDTQLTWMDAKIGDWVVTPRYGKPVEINGLWINALRAVAWISERLKKPAGELLAAADRAEESFHRKFWSPVHGWYFDTVDPLDAQLRPNQLIPLALPFGPLQAEHAEKALVAAETHLLTPKGLRTLAPFEIHYQGSFQGPLPELDAAYHQGTVWPWLLGIYYQACRRVRGTMPYDDSAVDRMLREYGLGGIAECYDGDPPHLPGGCPWQAWSVATLAEARHQG